MLLGLGLGARWLGVAIAAGWLLGASFNLSCNQETRWTKSIYQQKVALAKAELSPRRVLVVGGSATHYGIDAAKMQKKLDIPVYNFGFHAGLGLDVLLGLSVKEIRSGDLILLMPEQSLLQFKDGNGPVAAHFGLSIGNPAVGEVQVDQVVQKWALAGSPSLQTFLRDFRAILRRLPDLGQTKVSAQGDAITFPSGGNPTPKSPPSHVSDYTLQQLQAFREAVEQRGGTLILGLPWMYSKADKTAINREKALIQSLSQVAPIVYNPKTLNLISDATLFADTEMHLSEEGRKKRTRELIRQIRPYVESEDL